MSEEPHDTSKDRQEEVEEKREREATGELPDMDGKPEGADDLSAAAIGDPGPGGERVDA